MTLLGWAETIDGNASGLDRIERSLRSNKALRHLGFRAYRLMLFAHEACDVAVEADRDAPPVLKVAKHALDDVALVVDGLVVISADCAVLARRNDRLGATLPGSIVQRLAGDRQMVDIFNAVNDRTTFGSKPVPEL